MNKAQKTMIIFFVLVILVVASLYLISVIKTKNPTMLTGNIIYYSEKCPHCKNVEAFIEENEIDSKINITRKEIINNLTNKAEFTKVIEYCKINPEEAGVPFIYISEENKCIMGDADIINFLKEKLNITKRD